MFCFHAGVEISERNLSQLFYWSPPPPSSLLVPLQSGVSNWTQQTLWSTVQPGRNCWLRWKSADPARFNGERVWTHRRQNRPDTGERARSDQESRERAVSAGDSHSACLRHSQICWKTPLVGCFYGPRKPIALFLDVSFNQMASLMWTRVLFPRTALKRQIETLEQYCLAPTQVFLLYKTKPYG